MLWYVALLCVAVAFGHPRQADVRPPASKGGMITGRVVTWDTTGHPVPRAAVRLVATRGENTLCITDDQGRFTFTNLRAGRYALTVSKPAFVTSYYGSRLPWRGPSTPIVLSENGRPLDVLLPIVRGAVITGAVRNTTGEPISNAQVRVFEVQTASATVRRPIAAASTSTDDLGAYRVYGLPPGTYVVAARWPESERAAFRPTTDAEVNWAHLQDPRARTGSLVGASMTSVPNPASPSIYVPVYYPNATDVASAETLTLESGGTRTLTDITLQPVTAGAIAGSVHRPDGTPATGAVLSVLRSGTSALIDMVALTLRPDSQGTFLASPLSPGVYAIVARESPAVKGARASTSDSAVGSLWATDQIVVSAGSSQNVQLRLQRAPIVSGRIVFDGGNPPAVGRIRLGLIAEVEDGVPRPSLSAAHPQANGTFVLAAGAPGRYTLSVTPPDNESKRWSVKSAMSRIQNLLDPVELRAGEDLSDVVITISDRTTELIVAVVNAAETFGASALVVSVDQRYWTYPSRRTQLGRLAADGEARFVDLPPGDYSVTILTDPTEVDLRDARVIEALASTGVRVSVSDGKTTTLKLAAGRE
jgi:uncharacterized protein (DUF2141 family)